MTKKYSEMLCVELTIIAMMIICLLVFGCQTASRSWGGSTTINLPANQKLINVEWGKSDSLWYLTRERHKDEKPETYTFKEESNFGAVEGKVVFIEH